MTLVGSVKDEMEKPWNRLVIVTADDIKSTHGSVFEFVDELQFRLSGEFDVAFVGPDEEDDGHGDQIVLMTRPIMDNVEGQRVYIVPDVSNIKSGFMAFRVRSS